MQNFDAGQGDHYFGYYVKNEIVGYVRLYGWKNNYWGPGVYFSGPGQGTGALGPIGIAAHQRGLRLGSQIMKLAWEVLKEKGCRLVRVDWTTEISFYQRAGLKIVQKYQPASIATVPTHD